MNLNLAIPELFGYLKIQNRTRDITYNILFKMCRMCFMKL